MGPTRPLRYLEAPPSLEHLGPSEDRSFCLFLVRYRENPRSHCPLASLLRRFTQPPMMYSASYAKLSAHDGDDLSDGTSTMPTPTRPWAARCAAAFRIFRYLLEIALFFSVVALLLSLKQDRAEQCPSTNLKTMPHCNAPAPSKAQLQVAGSNVCKRKSRPRGFSSRPTRTSSAPRPFPTCRLWTLRGNTGHE